MVQSSLPTTRNVMRVLRNATPAQWEAGLTWYAEAHAFCTTLAAEHGVSVATVAGITAAGSPLNSWGSNRDLAARWLRRWAAGQSCDRYLGTGCRKGDAILAGADPLSQLRSDKVRNFFLCILTAGTHADAVCVDRHAWDITTNTRNTDESRPALTGKRYAAAAETYRRAARIASRERGHYVSPAQVQAITWLAWRRRFWSEGAYDGASQLQAIGEPNIVNGQDWGVVYRSTRVTA